MSTHGQECKAAEERVTELLGERVRTFARHFAYRQRVFEALRDGVERPPTAQDLNSAHLHLQDEGKAICEFVTRMVGTPPWMSWSPPEVP